MEIALLNDNQTIGKLDNINQFYWNTTKPKALHITGNRNTYAKKDICYAHHNNYFFYINYQGPTKFWAKTVRTLV